jgi:hypothetical protein
MAIVITEREEIAVPAARADGEALWFSAPGLERATGWALKPEGLCKDDVCVPLPPGREREITSDGRIDVAAFWRHLGKPVLHSDDGGAWSLGEGAKDRMAALRTLEAPDFALPDPAGRPHRLSEQRGKKVLLVTWASW